MQTLIIEIDPELCNGCQVWTFSIIDKRSRVTAFGTEIANYYRRLNRLAKKRWLRQILKFCGKPELDHYYHEYYDSI